VLFPRLTIVWTELPMRSPLVNGPADWNLKVCKGIKDAKSDVVVPMSFDVVQDLDPALELGEEFAHVIWYRAV
jgi:hypothetical protein